MGYESLSTVVVLVIIGIIMTVWLPRKTVNGMKQAEKHRSDRYSTSLHVVDEHSGTRFSDEYTPRAKGAIMPTPQSNREDSREYIAYVRGLRRAAARRRAWLAGGLAVITIVVAVAAYVMHFNMLFALIPAVLLAAVLILGHRASVQARAWEARVAQREKAHNRSRSRSHAQGTGTTARNRQRTEIVNAAEQSPNKSQEVQEEAHTDVLEQREIRRALYESRKAQQEALARRSAAHEAAQSTPAQAERSNEHAQLVVREEANVYALDETNELAEVKAASSIDAFEMAANQDLISFSLGETRNGVEIAQAEPESLEIKSTRQVAKAQPKQEVQSQAAQSSISQPEHAEKEDKEPVIANASSVNDSVAFHETEASASVEAPDETTDSLGVNLDSILARRGN